MSVLPYLWQLHNGSCGDELAVYDDDEEFVRELRMNHDFMSTLESDNNQYSYG